MFPEYSLKDGTMCLITKLTPKLQSSFLPFLCVWIQTWRVFCFHWFIRSHIQLLTCGVFQLSYFVIKKNSELSSKIWLRMNQWKQKTLQVWIQTHRKGRKELCNFGVNFVIKHMVPSFREYSGNIIVFTSDNIYCFLC
jgi:hypothetical protein